MSVSVAWDRFRFVVQPAPAPDATQVAGTGEQGARVGASVGVRTPAGRKQFPASVRLLPLLPCEVTGEQVKGIDFLRVSLGTWLQIGVDQIPGTGFAGRVNPRCAPSRSEVGMIAQDNDPRDMVWVLELPGREGDRKNSLLTRWYLLVNNTVNSTKPAACAGDCFLLSWNWGPLCQTGGELTTLAPARGKVSQILCTWRSANGRRWTNEGTSLFGTSSETETREPVAGTWRNFGNLPISRHHAIDRCPAAKSSDNPSKPCGWRCPKSIPQERM